MIDSPATRATVRDALRAWYFTRRRPLPWRDRPTPYRVWVSEIMLQQTQVATVLPYFERFMAVFPDVQALAAAPLDQVLTLWSGLGYYRRARHLHAAAAIVARDLGGALPADVTALRRLPGVGRYTAGAIASIAFGQPAPLLDGNVARVLARLVALGEPVNASAGQRALWSLAEALLDPSDPSSHNQALMELGALVCTPKRPGCDECPLAPYCAARISDNVARYPVKRARAKARATWAVCGVIERDDGHLLLAKRPASALLGGLWELPGGELASAQASAPEALTRHLRARLGLRATVGAQRATISHVFSHRRLTLAVYDVACAGAMEPRVSWYTRWRWHDPRAPRDLPISRLADKVLAALGGRQ